MGSPTCYTYMESPIGRLLLVGDADRLTGVEFPSGHTRKGIQRDWRRTDVPFRETIRQLEAYFEGKLRRFDLPLAPGGTSFQRDTWDALLEIPYGQTTSYAEIARRIGRPTATRAVGAANGANRLPIVIPCHRVVGSNGNLTGFGGGLPIKRRLLELEGVKLDARAPTLFDLSL